MLLKIEAYSYCPSLLRDLHGCESEVQVADNEDNDVAALDNDVYFDWLVCSHHCKSLEVKVANGNKI